MASEWIETTLGALVIAGEASLQTGPFGTVLKASEYSKEGVPLISVREIRYGSLEVGADTPRVGPATVTRLPTYVLRKGDIVFGRKGGVDRNCMLSEQQDGWFLGSDGIRLRMLNGTNPAFISFQLRSADTRNWLLAQAEGTTMASLNQEILGRLPIRLPSSAVQRSVAELLTKFDERIGLLASASATLEATARAIFKSWFVDFDPVRAKAEGREPEGIDAAIAALFPSEFFGSENKLVPKSWSIKSLSEFIEINPGRTLSKKEAAAYLEMANAPTHGPRPSAWVRKIPISGCRFTNGDTLLAKITPCLENGKTAFVDFLAEGETGWGSTEFLVLTPKPPIPSVFGYLLARDADFRVFAIQSMSGTSGRQRVQPDQLAKFKFAIADAPVYQAFSQVVEPLFACIGNNANLASTLSELRDTLLPRLISGRLRIAEAEEIVEAAL